jgi:hypothetical protein
MGAAALAAETRFRIVECLICQARTDEALEILDELSGHSPERAPMLTWLRAHALAVVGDDAAAGTMTEAADLLAGVGQPYEHALARIALARLTGTDDAAAHADLAALGAEGAFVLPLDRSTGRQVDRSTGQVNDQSTSTGQVTPGAFASRMSVVRSEVAPVISARAT